MRAGWGLSRTYDIRGCDHRINGAKMKTRLINMVRHQYYLSLLFRIGLRPVQKSCEWVSQQIRMKVWANGAATNYDGVKVRFPRNVGVGICSNIYWNGVNGFEPYTWNVIKHFLPRSKIFIDIGSNIGIYSVLAKKVNPALEVQSYEPIPSIYRKSIAFHTENNVSAANVINAAIGDEDGEATIFLPIVNGGMEEESTATLRKDSWQHSKAHKPYVVSTRKLDSVLSEKDARVLIKIDVEDYEASVLRGAAKVLRSIKPIIVCEILPRAHGNQETFDILQENDYLLFGISASGLMRFGRQDLLARRPFTDFLLVPASIAPGLNFISHENLGAVQWA
jgi:FkbM family methyltransferase